MAHGWHKDVHHNVMWNAEEAIKEWLNNHAKEHYETSFFEEYLWYGKMLWILRAKKNGIEDIFIVWAFEKEIYPYAQSNTFVIYWR